MSYDYYCKHCDEESELEVDGFEILDSECPECGMAIDYISATQDLISGMVDRATDTGR